jgi:hypothetical protein
MSEKKTRGRKPTKKPYFGLNTTTGAWLTSGIYTSATVAVIYSLKINNLYLIFIYNL